MQRPQWNIIARRVSVWCCSSITKPVRRRYSSGQIWRCIKRRKTGVIWYISLNLECPGLGRCWTVVFLGGSRYVYDMRVWDGQEVDRGPGDPEPAQPRRGDALSRA